jgi:hypothetical protein
MPAEFTVLFHKAPNPARSIRAIRSSRWSALSNSAAYVFKVTLTLA